MRKSLDKVGLSLAGMLAACGGGGGGGSTVPVVNAPSPTPTGTPAPSATRFAAAAAGPLAGTITFDLNGNGVADPGEPTAATDLSGYGGAGHPGLYANSGAVPTTAGARLLALGPDVATGFFASSLSAPGGSTVVSPITTLIDRVGDQAAVRRALGLAETGGVRATTDLLRFDAAQRLADADPAVVGDARQVVATNFRLLVLAQLLSQFQGNPVDVGSGSGEIGFLYLADQIREGGAADLTQKAVILRLLQRAQLYLNYQPDQADAVAGLVAAFMSAVPAGFADAGQIVPFNLAFRFYVLANIRAGSSGPADVARLRAITRDQIVAAAGRFADFPRPPVGSAAYALPDYVRIAGPITVPAATVLRNDIAGFPYGAGPDAKTITAVTLDPANAGQATVTLVAGDVRIEPTSGFSGYLRVRYVARARGVDTESVMLVAVGVI